jgi:hypothetical protein
MLQVFRKPHLTSTHRCLRRLRQTTPLGEIVAHATIAAAAAAANAQTRARIVAPLAEGQGEGEVLPMIVQVGSSTTYPLTFADMFNVAGAGKAG